MKLPSWLRDWHIYLIFGLWCVFLIVFIGYHVTKASEFHDQQLPTLEVTP